MLKTLTNFCPKYKFSVIFFKSSPSLPPSCPMKLSPSMKPYFYPSRCHIFWSPSSYDFCGAHICALHCAEARWQHGLWRRHCKFQVGQQVRDVNYLKIKVFFYFLCIFFVCSARASPLQPVSSRLCHIPHLSTTVLQEFHLLVQVAHLAHLLLQEVAHLALLLHEAHLAHCLLFFSWSFRSFSKRTHEFYKNILAEKKLKKFFS